MTKIALFDQLERFGPAPALIAGDRTISYAQLAERADRFAQTLPSERCLVFLEAANTLDAISAYAGCLRADHVVHLFAKLDHARLDHLTRRFGARVILLPDGEDLRVELLPGGGQALHPQLAVLLSTSGSTGSPKLVKLSHRNLRSNADAIASYLGLTPADRALTSLDFNYSYGLSVINSHLIAGATLVLTDASVTEPRFWDNFATHGCTSFAGVPYTFDLLARSSQWASMPSLRYVTAAGGRLEPQRVREIAQLGQRHGWDFYVMYGQTEAAPRMAYLPPHLAQIHPDHIGGPIPGGELLLLDEDGQPVEDRHAEGELAYRGPNVMMGYASRACELASDETPGLLRTGDIAVRTAPDLFKIVGRKARFVKPFGLRINLDEVEAIAREAVHAAVAGGDDQRIVVAAPALPLADCERLQASLAHRLSLPATAVAVRSVNQLPLLSNGKTDYRAVTALAPPPPIQTLRPVTVPKLAQAVDILTSRRFYRRIFDEALFTLGLKQSDWADVRSIFQTLVGKSGMNDDSSFASLGGDSMCFVQTSLALETYLGFLPDNWELLSVNELEEMRAVPAGF